MEVKPARRKIVGSIQTTRPSTSSTHSTISTPPPTATSYGSRPGYVSAPASTRSAPPSSVGVGPSKVRAINGASSSTAKTRVKVQPSSLAGSPAGAPYAPGGGETSWNGGSSVGARPSRAPSPGGASLAGSTSSAPRARPVSVRSYSPAPQGSASAVGGPSQRPLVNGHVRANSGGSAASFASAPPSAHHTSYNSHLAASTSSPRPRVGAAPTPPVPPLPRSISTGFNSLPRSRTTTSTPKAQLLPSLFPPSSPAPQSSSPPSYFNSTPPLLQPKPYGSYSPPPLLSPPDTSPVANGRDRDYRRASVSSSLSEDSPDSKSNLSSGPRRDALESSPSAKSVSSHPLSPTFSSLSAARSGPPPSSSTSIKTSNSHQHLASISSPPPVSYFNSHALPTIPASAAFNLPTSPTTTFQQPRLLSRGSIGSSMMGGQAEADAEETPEMEEKRKEKEEMKVNRKIADLEISNASLLAVNRMLEATKAKQTKEIRDLRRRLRTGSVHPVASMSRPRRLSKIDIDGNEVSDEEDDSDESGEDEQFVRLRGTMLSLLERAQQAVSTPITTSSNREGIGSPGAYGGTRVLGILEVEKWQEGEDADSQDGGHEGDLSFVSEGVEEAEENASDGRPDEQRGSVGFSDAEAQ